jgi:ABC-type antimicrobial peptide transport system permease subunit
MVWFLVKRILLGNKLRSAVPLLGIIIGVGSIMGIFAISSGGEAAVKKDLASIAENRVIIGSDRGFDIDDIKLVENLPVVEYVYTRDTSTSLSVDTSTLIRPDGHLLPQRAKGDSTGESDIKIEGYSRKAILNKDLEVVGEKYLHGKNVLIGDKTAIDIFGDSDVVGRNFEITLNSGKKVEHRVIGVYKEELGDTFGIPSIYIDLDE